MAAATVNSVETARAAKAASNPRAQDAASNRPTANPAANNSSGEGLIATPPRESIDGQSKRL